jgi:hypothetical protein
MEFERTGTPATPAERQEREKMISRETLRKMCEWPISVSLIGAAIQEWVGLSAEQKARWIWGMEGEKEKEGDDKN